MSSCDLRHHPKACVVTRQKYRRPGCAACEDGVLNARAVVKALPAPIEPQPTIKEEIVAEKLSAKERILGVITRRQSCVSTPILQNCPGVKADEFRQIADELEREGKIKIHTDGRKTIFALPGVANQFAGEEKKPAGTGNNRQQPAATCKPAPPKSPGSPPLKNGGGRTRASSGNALEAALEELVAKRAQIDAAIDGIRALIG